MRFDLKVRDTSAEEEKVAPHRGMRRLVTLSGGAVLSFRNNSKQHRNSMSLSSTISKKQEKKEHVEPRQQQQQRRRQANGDEQLQRKEDSDEMLRMEIADDSPLQRSFAAASLLSLSDENESEKDDELPNLMQYFLRNKIVEQNSSLFHRFPRQDGTMITTRTSHHLRSDVSAITLDTALEPIPPTEVPLLKDMTTFFSSLPNPSNDALKMRRASLSAATSRFPPEPNTLKQPRRASVAGGEPYLDSSLSNARQPRRIIEYPPPTKNKNTTQGLIMPQRRSSSPKPPTSGSNKTSTMLPFVSSPPNHRHRPDPQALTPTDRDPHPLATFLIHQKKLEPTGRAATGGHSTRFPEASPSTPDAETGSTSPVSSQTSLPLPPLPVSSPSSASKQSLSSLEKNPDTTQKRSRRPKSPTKTKHEPANQQDMTTSTHSRREETMPEEVANSPPNKIPKRKSSPRRIRQTENKAITNALDASVSQPKTMNETVIRKKQASPRKVRPAETNRARSRPVSNEQHMDVSSSGMDKPTTLSPKQAMDGLPSPRKKQPKNGLVGIPIISLSESGVEPEENASPCRSVARKFQGQCISRTAHDPRKTQPSTHDSEPTVSTTKTTDVTEISPGSVKRRIRSSPGKRRGRSASMNHMSNLMSSTMTSASSKVIHGQTAISTAAEHIPSECIDDKELNGQTVGELTSTKHGTSRNQSPTRSSRSIRFVTTDSLKTANDENGRRRSPFRRKQRASSIGHVPFSKKVERQIETSLSGVSPRIINSKANRGEGVSAASPNKALPSPRRRRRRVASMQHVSTTILDGDDVKSFGNNGNNLSVSRGRRAMSMQHVSIPEGDDENDKERQNYEMALLGTKPLKPFTERLLEPRNLTLRHSLSSEFMSITNYDSAPESQNTPTNHGEARAKFKLEHTRSRSSGFNPDLVIKDLTSFANAVDFKSDRLNASCAKTNDLLGVAVGLFRRVEKKSASNHYDESSINYAKTGSLLQERYRPSTS
ncbi:hypothetical protein FisN_14Hh022 [Fistulifera solaris]|uniref:Uncharacterized protein n=1 Tax=Fistulifera solaris TaxID=1519565 RepID=A0A1Z5K834_FISSO|nr:hypothetical protein FisN_14Hh022 [Fistulifera solaris]|eukprot:GAX22409.1 hypothetical protein FisN_14Hh022 [Fistulifera solaris]